MFKIASPPAVHGFQHRAYGLPEGRERVFYSGRDHREDLAVDEPIFFQFTELLGEHLGRGGRNGAAQFGKAHGAGNEFPQDECFVLAADEAERGFHGAVL